MTSIEPRRLDYFVIAVGFALMLAGVSFYLADEKRFGALVLILAGVGSSVLATGITNLIASSRLLSLPLHSVLEALAERTKLIRRDHVLMLDFDMQGETVRLTKKHEFALFNPSRSFSKELSMYTDTVSWRHETRGGFTRVQEPDGNQLVGEALAAHLIAKNGKVYFRKTYRFPSREEAAFVLYSEEFYRKADRLIWTVEDLAEDFKIYIHNHTGVRDAFAIKINHHREAEISSRVITHQHGPNRPEEIHFTFGSEILPYQGFEVMWDLDPTDDDRNRQSTVA